MRGVAFPKLDKSQMAALGGCPLTALKRYRDGENFSRRAPVTSLVAKSGTVKIVDKLRETPKTIAIHGSGISPATSLLTGSLLLFSGVAGVGVKSTRYR